MVSALQSIYDSGEAEAITYMVLEELLLVKKHHVYLLDKTLSETETQLLNKVLARLLQSEPVQYVLGKCHFMGLDLHVNKHVLIPRPETEELVKLVYDKIHLHPNSLTIADIGTGSGCIAISLKKMLAKATVYATDISENALQTARENAQLNYTDIIFIHDNVLQPDFDKYPSKVDCIVSNPPYITAHEKLHMHSNVLNHEPHQALFVSGDDAMEYYSAIIYLTNQKLSPQGFVFFEVNEMYAHQVKQRLAEAGYISCEVHIDMQGKERFVSGQRNTV
jgi:release factor glutamine methyltransferase